ncbi:hypothetical protein [Scytonema sp. UIC 10036]|uniref:type II toxin-antitoxin system Phd/YefM family antitoxin n=1 Tax=Scytonema sp. UIC 10036 TaxID=2304196 RepID=UPI001A9AEF04|nr:hypothetical protein [Scytonema sp. UIC 10036]
MPVSLVNTSILVDFNENLARYVRKNPTHNEILITRNGMPIARIVSLTINSDSDVPHNYPLRGMPITISEDFDEAMPELWDALSQ